MVSRSEKTTPPTKYAASLRALRKLILRAAGALEMLETGWPAEAAAELRAAIAEARDKIVD